MRTFLIRLCVVALLLVFFWQVAGHTVSASITFDEGPHLAVGYTVLKTRDFRLQPVHIHPPLANELAAIPLLLQHDLPDPRTIDGWQSRSLSAVTDEVIWQYPHPRRIATAGRLPIIGLGIILAALVYRWAADRGGLAAGLVAVAFYTVDPNIIAHSSLITTDVAAVTFIVLTLYLVDRQIIRAESFTYTAAAGIGLSLGLAQLTKVSALMLMPVVVGIILLEAWFRSDSPWQGIRSVAPLLLVILGTAAFALWAGYGFEVRSIDHFLEFPIPAATHVEIFRSLREHYNLGHPTFAAGQLSDRGWWWYFPLAFLIKTPLPLLSVAVLTGACVIVRLVRSRRHRVDWVRSTPLWVFPLLYGFTSLFSSVNIGYRHLLPLLPFLFVGIGIGISRLASRLDRPTHRRMLNLSLAALLLWQGTSTLSLSTHPLTFFNALVGGPDNGYRYLVDSNLDWGQNLWDLKRWMEQHDETHVNYAHYSPARLEPYGIEGAYLPPDPKARPFTPWAPRPGLYAIGATVLQGPYAPDPNTFAWFRAHTPIARLGNALFLYRVEAGPAAPLPPKWAILCAGSGLDAETVQDSLDNPALRVIPLDCSQAQVRPALDPGLVIAPQTSVVPKDGEHCMTLRGSHGRPIGQVYQVAETESKTSESSLELEGPLTFSGFSVVRPTHAEDALVLQTRWRIESAPRRPLSIMAHLVAPGGEVVAVGDSLSYPIELWRPGDLLIQRHEWTLPSELTPGNYTLRTGAYWLDTMERWSVASPEGAAPAEAADSIDLTTIHLP